MIFKVFKLLTFGLLVFCVSAAGFTPQFADASKSLRIRWKNPTIRLALSTSLLEQQFNIKPETDVEETVRRSLETWEKAANVEFETYWTDKTTVSQAGSSGDGVSLITIAATPDNLALFQNNWGETSAQTRTFFNRRGFITESDIVLNPFQQFSTDGTFGTFDLESTLTHEIGHLLGLEHSFVMGATMYIHQGKNGVFNLPSYSPRTLSEDDISGIRALYGVKESDEDCCGEIRGKLTLPNGKPARDFQVWAEDAENGRVISGVVSNSNGEFLFDGLVDGEYRIYAQKKGEKSEKSFSSEEIGKVELKNNKSVELTKKLQAKTTAFNLKFTGFNGQVSELAVPVNGGKSYMIYIGGKNLEAEDLEMNFNSPDISVVPNSRLIHDYGEDVSVVSFEVRIAKNAPLGEYGIFVSLRGDRTACLAGSLTVEEFENNWSNGFFDK